MVNSGVGTSVGLLQIKQKKEKKEQADDEDDDGDYFHGITKINK